jgi:hypothetical protein
LSIDDNCATETEVHDVVLFSIFRIALQALGHSGVEPNRIHSDIWKALFVKILYKCGGTVCRPKKKKKNRSWMSLKFMGATAVVEQVVSTQE